MSEMGVAIVTGAGGGIGRAVCAELANRGYPVIAVDRNAKTLENLAKESLGQGALIRTEALDLTDKAAIEEMTARIGEIKILVNNAGIFDVTAFADLTADDFRRHYEVNLITSVDMIHAVLPQMREGSSILNMASVAMFGAAYSAHYAASKAAVGALTKTLAVELAGRRIRVNAIAPGAVRTPMLLGRGDNFAENVVSRIPLGRLGEPEDIAAAVGFLTSDQAQYITGQVLVVDGGAKL